MDLRQHSVVHHHRRRIGQIDLPHPPQDVGPIFRPAVLLPEARPQLHRPAEEERGHRERRQPPRQIHCRRLPAPPVQLRDAQGQHMDEHHHQTGGGVEVIQLHQTLPSLHMPHPLSQPSVRYPSAMRSSSTLASRSSMTWSLGPWSCSRLTLMAVRGRTHSRVNRSSAS